MEQVENGDLIVTRASAPSPSPATSSTFNEDARDLGTVDGFDAAVKLAQANLDDIIKSRQAPAPTADSTNQIPVSYSYVYLRVQPFFSSYTIPPTSTEATEHSDAHIGGEKKQLQFLLYLSDPSHGLTHTTLTQSVPAAWVEESVPTNQESAESTKSMWDTYEWVEDLVAEALRVGVEVVGQEYVVNRMGWGGAPAAATVGAAKAPSSDAAGEAGGEKEKEGE